MRLTEQRARTVPAQNPVASLSTLGMHAKGRRPPEERCAFGDLCLAKLTAKRCRRIGKDCVQSGPKRKRDPMKSAKDRNERLEAKIDGLVSLLASTSNGSPGTAPGATPELPGPQNPSFAIPHQLSTEILQAENVSSGASLQVLEEYSIDNGQELLDEFLACKLIHLPFFAIPPQTPVQQLQATQPFLWLCIQAVSTRSTLQQSKLYAHIRSILGHSMVSELEKSLEQLLGILVCIAWGNLQVHRRPFLTIFTQLAISAVFDLGLNVKPPSGPDERANYRFHKPWISNARTVPERRAVLGCYFLSSIVSSYLDRIDTLRWTPHMNECLHHLENIKECEGDAILVVLIKLQRIVEKVRASYLHKRELESAVKDPSSAFYVKALRAELEDIKRQMPTEIQNDRVVLAYLHHTTLKIHEFTLLLDTPMYAGVDFSRVETLFQCLTTVKSYFDIFFTFAPKDYLGFSTPTFFQLTHSLHCLYKLTAIEDPGWDKNEVAKLVDLLGIGRLIIQNLREGAVSGGFSCDGQEDHLTKVAQMVESAINSWQFKLQAQVTNTASLANIQNVEASGSEGLVLSLTDEFWLGDFLTPPEWQE